MVDESLSPAHTGMHLPTAPPGDSGLGCAEYRRFTAFEDLQTQLRREILRGICPKQGACRSGASERRASDRGRSTRCGTGRRAAAETTGWCTPLTFYQAELTERGTAR